MILMFYVAYSWVFLRLLILVDQSGLSTIEKSVLGVLLIPPTLLFILASIIRVIQKVI